MPATGGNSHAHPSRPAPAGPEAPPACGPSARGLRPRVRARRGRHHDGQRGRRSDRGRPRRRGGRQLPRDPAGPARGVLRRHPRRARAHAGRAGRPPRRAVGRRAALLRPPHPAPGLGRERGGGHPDQPVRPHRRRLLGRADGGAGPGARPRSRRAERGARPDPAHHVHAGLPLPRARGRRRSLVEGGRLRQGRRGHGDRRPRHRHRPGQPLLRGEAPRVHARGGSLPRRLPHRLPEGRRHRLPRHVRDRRRVHRRRLLHQDRGRALVRGRTSRLGRSQRAAGEAVAPRHRGPREPHREHGRGRRGRGGDRGHHPGDHRRHRPRGEDRGLQGVLERARPVEGDGRRLRAVGHRRRDRAGHGRRRRRAQHVARRPRQDRGRVPARPPRRGGRRHLRRGVGGQQRPRRRHGREHRAVGHHRRGQQRAAQLLRDGHPRQRSEVRRRLRDRGITRLGPPRARGGLRGEGRHVA